MKLGLKTTLIPLILVSLGAPGQAQPEYPVQAFGQPDLLLTLDAPGNVGDTPHGIGFEPAANGMRFEEKIGTVPGSGSETPEAPATVTIMVKPAPKAHSGGSAPVIPMARPSAAEPGAGEP